jgi:hypothetical protein
VTLAIVLPVALAACSNASSTGGSTTTTRASGHIGTTSACTLVSPATIQKVLDRTVKAAEVTNSTVATACTYPSADTSRSSDSVIVAFRGRVTQAVAAGELAATRKLQPTITDVSGSGDTAYAFTSKARGGETVTTLVTLVDETQVTVSSTASVAQAEALTQQIFSTLAGEASSTTTTTAG